jgi:hypothetical protein
MKANVQKTELYSEVLDSDCERKSVLDFAIQYCAKSLGISGISICCEVVNHHSNGYCEFDDEDGSILIEVGEASLSRMLRVISHEMIHAKQFLEGKLTMKGPANHVCSSIPFFRNLQKKAYFLDPCEWEAYLGEGKLYKSLKKRLKKENFDLF